MFQRREVTTIVQRTVKEHISKPNQRCGEEDNPDSKMIDLIIESVGCKMPWSNEEMYHLRNCLSLEDFQSYFDSIEKLQEDFQRIPMKCTYNSWTAMPHTDDMFESPNTSVYVGLFLYGGKVNYFTF